jgi:hypothetical protein
MLQVTYLCFILLRLTRREITHRARVALFSRRLAGFLGGVVLGSLIGWQFGLFGYVLALWLPVLFGELAALAYAREAHLPGANGPRLPPSPAAPPPVFLLVLR